MDPRLYRTHHFGSQIILDFGSFILDRLSESDYNISRPFIFDRVEERAIE